MRDYIHVVDLALGHIKILQALDSQKMPGSGCMTINLGTGVGYSVLEMVHAFEQASGRPVPYKITPRRPGDIASCYADATLAFDLLGWKAQRGLSEMCADAWRWQKGSPDGYGVKDQDILEDSFPRIAPKRRSTRKTYTVAACSQMQVISRPFFHMQLLIPVVLSGGSGTRLWPLSREKYPKQLLPLTGEDSLLQATVRRMDGLADVEVGPPLVRMHDTAFIATAPVMGTKVDRTGAGRA